MLYLVHSKRTQWLYQSKIVGAGPGLEPSTKAMHIANQQETVEIAQKWLHKEKHLTSEALALETDIERLQLGVATQPSANTTRHGRNSEIEELTTQVRYLTKEVAQLRGERADWRQRGPVCWGCRERGHLR